MGSPRYQTRELNSCLVTLAWFPPRAALESHVHDRPTFAIMLDGAFDLAFGSPAIRHARLPCPPGTILTEPAGEKHANFVAAGGAYVVVVQPDTGGTELPRRCAAFLDRINHFRDGPISGTARRLARELASPDDLADLAAEGLALEMLAAAARLEAGHDLGMRQAPRWLDRAVQFIHDRYRDAVRIQDVAAVAGVHPAHLAAVFRRLHRVPLASYVRGLRVEWAADQLLHTDKPISYISAEAGFADQAHLTRLFKRATGATPAAFRRARRPC